MTEVQPAHGTTDITPLLQPLRVGRLTLKMRDGRGAEIRPFRRTDLEWLT